MHFNKSQHAIQGELMQDAQAAAVMPALSQDDEARLVKAAQKNPALFREIYDRWAVPVYRYFYFRTRERSSAEDLTSQLFLKAYEALPRYRHRGHFAAWLFAIARNLMWEHFRKKRREVPLADAGQVVGESNPLAEVSQADEIEQLRDLIRSLPEDEQELIHLRYVTELRFADIALLLGRREDAVKKSLYRLQARLKSLLEQNHD
jgi:RNA polymerase sigma-70 factor (ECF subfamily)